MGMLRDRMIEEMTLRNFAADTQKSYLYAVTRLTKYYGRPPTQLKQQEIRAYLLYLINERKLASTTMTTVMAAYSAGLRVSELVNLKVQKIDPELMMIHIERSKDGKGRYTLLSHHLLQEFRTYWQRYQPSPWVFLNRAKDGPMSRSTAGHIYIRARQTAGIEKGRGIHTLRACFATHLLQAGTDLRTIQLLMGHTSILSTQRYLRLKQQNLGTTVSPLDLLQL